MIDGGTQNVETAVKKIAPEGADVVFECTGRPDCIDAAVTLCRAQGRFVWQGNYGAKPVSMDFLAAHMRRITAFFPCDDGMQPCRRAVIKNMASGALLWEKCISHRIPFGEAPAMFQRINEGRADDVTGVVIDWR